jgi:hypothetical protein
MMHADRARLTAKHAEERRGEARGDDHLEYPVELSLDAGVGGGVEVEDEELLREDDGHEEEAERAAARGACAVEVDGGARVDDEGETDDGVLVVVEAAGRDGAVGVERQEGGVVHEHLHDELEGAAGDDEGGLEVAGARHGEPDRRDVSVPAQGEEPNVVEQVPQADGEEAGAGQDVADAAARRAAHGRGCTYVLRSIRPTTVLSLGALATLDRYKRVLVLEYAINLQRSCL